MNCPNIQLFVAASAELSQPHFRFSPTQLFPAGRPSRARKQRSLLPCLNNGFAIVGASSGAARTGLKGCFKGSAERIGHSGALGAGFGMLREMLPCRDQLIPGCEWGWSRQKNPAE